eukprot:jgi/Chrpa1/19114/Chrysochromulina_OHIO_Genome00025465-RA
MPRTRSSTASSPFTSTLIGDIDLLQHVLSFLTKPALARLALANKVLADAVAERVLSPALWKPEDAALEIAEQMFALMNDEHVSLNQVGRSICAETFRTTKVKLIRLLGELDAPTSLITLLSKTESARSLRLARFQTQVVVFQEKALQHLIKACATSMVPARLIKFSADTAAVTYDPPRRCLVTGLRAARNRRLASNWADVWGGAIASSFHREKWTPALLQQLSKTCPQAQTKEVDVLVMLCKAALLDLEHLSKFVRCASTGPTVAASLICDYAQRRHFELLDNVSDETSYDDDEIEALNEDRYGDDHHVSDGIEIQDEAANLIKVMKAIDTPFEVVLQVMPLMGERDVERHAMIEESDRENQGHGASGDYDDFLGTEVLLNKYFGEGFDIKTLSSTKRQLLLEETTRLLARFKSPTLRRIVLQLALGWISQAVVPLKTTNKNAKKIALDVQRICSMLSV